MQAVMNAHEQHRPYLAVLVQSKNNVRWVSISIGATSEYPRSEERESP